MDVALFTVPHSGTRWTQETIGRAVGHPIPLYHTEPGVDFRKTLADVSGKIVSTLRHPIHTLIGHIIRGLPWTNQYWRDIYYAREEFGDRWHGYRVDGDTEQELARLSDFLGVRVVDADALHHEHPDPSNGLRAAYMRGDLFIPLWNGAKHNEVDEMFREFGYDPEEWTWQRQ